MLELTKLERAVLDKFLCGEHPLLAVLRQQAAACKAVSREVTGAGFFTQLDVGDAPLADELKGQVWDVMAEIPGSTPGAGFLLYVEQGRLDMLEGFTYENLMLDSVAEFTLHYLSKTRDWGSLL
jgi:hypothetical protein